MMEGQTLGNQKKEIIITQEDYNYFQNKVLVLNTLKQKLGEVELSKQEIIRNIEQEQLVLNSFQKELYIKYDLPQDKSFTIDEKRKINF